MVPEYLLKRGAPGKRGEKEGRGRGKKKGKKKKKGKGGDFSPGPLPGTQFESLECFFFRALDLEKEDTRCDVTMADQHRGERAQARKVLEYVSGGLGS